jgi:hypothetical protein
MRPGLTPLARRLLGQPTLTDYARQLVRAVEWSKRLLAAGEGAARERRSRGVRVLTVEELERKKERERERVRAWRAARSRG